MAGETDINGQPIDPNFGPEPVDQFTPEDPASAVLALGLKTMSDADAQAAITAVQTAINNAQANSAPLQTLNTIISTLAPFVKLI